LRSLHLEKMGPHLCIPVRSDCSADIQVDKVQTICLELGYSKSDVAKMRSFFSSIDISMTGQVDSVILSKSLKLQNLDFSSLIMDLFAVGDDRGITFEDFTIACWIIFTIEESAMAAFIFHLFDIRGYGRISGTEFEAITDAALDLPAGTKSLVMSFFLKLGGDITAQTFSQAAIEYPCLVRPLQQFCKKLRHELVGERRCNELRGRRRELFGNLSLIQIVALMPIQPQSYKRLIDAHGIHGNIADAKSSFNEIALFNEVNDSEHGILVRYPKTYYSAIFLMEPLLGNKVHSDRKRSKASLYTTLYRSCVDYPSPNSRKQSRRSTYTRSNKIYPGALVASQTHSIDSVMGTRSSELSRSMSPREEAMKALQQWSTDITPGVNSCYKKKKHRGRSKSSSRRSLQLDSNHRDNSIQFNGKAGVSNDLIKEIEASFWVPGAVKNKENSIHPTATSCVGRKQSERRLV
jgi:Ca2+-binding EF-hand superfamily protein